MPGKVNPVIPEVVTQVAAQVIGNDAAITIGGMSGQFELNVDVPMIARNLLQSIGLLASASRLLAERCVDGIEANREQCERYAELTLSAATALTPYIGYDKATEIVKEAASSGRSLREVAREAGVEESVLDAALDYRAMAEPHERKRDASLDCHPRECLHFFYREARFGGPPTEQGGESCESERSLFRSVVALRAIWPAPRMRERREDEEAHGSGCAADGRRGRRADGRCCGRRPAHRSA
jgi:lambda repressor-like predicted transcriptional regulator